MSKNTFALLSNTQSDDVKEIIKNANTSDKKQDVSEDNSKKQTAPKNNNNQNRGNNRRPQSSPATPAADSNFQGGEFDSEKPQRGGKRNTGYAPPRRGFAYDRSISRQNRGRGMKKGGAGGHNWGKPEDTFAANQEQTETPATPATPTADAAEKPADAPAPAQTQPEVEEEKDDTVSFAEYEKKRREALEKLGLKQAAPRAAGSEIAVDPKALKFGSEVKREKAEIKIKSETKTEAKTEIKTDAKTEKKSKKGEVLNLGELLKDVPSRPPTSERRGGRGGRGRGGFGGDRGGRGGFGGRGGRGGRGRGSGPRSAPPPQLSDASSFPALK